MPFCTDLSPDSPDIGGKARSLARLAAAGLPVPTGFAITGALFRALRSQGPAWPPGVADVADLFGFPDQAIPALRQAPFPVGFLEELEARLRALGSDRFSVRSSFAREDQPGAIAPGVFASVTGVRGSEVAGAVRDVLASALTAGAVAYARRTGGATEPDPVAVLVHAFVPGDAHGSAALDPTSASGPVLDARPAPPRSAVRATLLAALETLTRPGIPIEVEWVATGDRVTFLQARPYAPPRAAAWPELEALRAEGWRWDAEHNPDPLSPAQQGLVELADERCKTGFRQKVVRGYLFVAPGGPAPLETLRPSQARAFYEELKRRAEAGLAGLGDPPDLEEALELFLTIYEPLFGVLRPQLRGARENLESFLAARLPDAIPDLPALLSGVPSKATERLARADRIRTAATPAERAHAIEEYVELFGDEASAWDLMYPTARETQEALLAREAPRRRRKSAPVTLWREAADRVEGRLPPATREAWREALRVARDAVEIGEDDDWLYARLQAAIRRALLAVQTRGRGGIDLVDEFSTIFFMPLAVSRSVARGEAPPQDAFERELGGWNAFGRAKASPPPGELAGGLGGPPPVAVRGSAGTGGRVVGRVGNEVRVSKTILPAELPLIEAKALVVETGGPLGHVAAQARERGIPAVVGARGAADAFTTGDTVLVDADAGLVVKLS